MGDFVWRGIVEGFYGNPWSHEERADMLSFMSEIGMNAYIYAPKNDPYHRRKWRIPYPAKQLASLKRLASHARSADISFVFAVSPGLSLRYSDKHDVDALTAKMTALHDVGVRDFALLLDDIPAQLANEADRRAFGSLAAAQVALANTVRDRLQKTSPQARLLVCPTQYSGDPSTDYLVEMGNGLHPQIDVMWTGPRVCSQELSFEHTEAVAASLRRPITFWDNYPVNDASMRGELHIWPYTGRSPALAQVSRGFFLNPMNQAEASKIALGAAAIYMKDPDRYDPEAAWRVSAARVVGEASVDALAMFRDACAISPLHPDDPPNLVRVVDDAKYRMDRGSLLEAAGILSSHMLEMKAAAELLRTNPNKKLIQEIAPWLDEYIEWADVGLEIARAVEAASSYAESLTPAGKTSSFSMSALSVAGARSRLARTLQRTIGFRTRVCSDVLLRLGLEIVRRLRY